ncbi:MAG TPA: hypothetical protein EYP53_01585 [Candidatus Latescibacteria bacterium]|nr:hypothetical protein [Candidatus Latescibacterota bacterium]
MTAENQPLLTNKFSERVLEVTKGRLIAGEIKNHLTGRMLKTGEEFGIRLARFQEDISSHQACEGLVSEDFLRVEAGHRMGKKEDARQDDFTAQLMVRSKFLPGSEFELLGWETEKEDIVQRMILRLRHPGEEIEVQATYELRASEPYLRKWLDLKNIGTGEVWVVDIDVEAFRTSDWQTSPKRGYPIFIGDDFFIGLEFPTWSKITTEEGLVLRHHPGKLLRPGESLTSKKAIVGVSGSGAIKEQFRRYLADTAIAKPREAPVSLYNDWGTHASEGATEEQTLARMQLLREVKAKYGLKFDYYIVDDGWAERPDEPWHIRKRNWPEGFGKLAEELKELDTKLGVWITFRCLAEREYWQQFRDGIFRLMDRYQLGWIKFDGGVTECTDPTHGHLTTFEHSQEALFEAFIEVLTGIRERNPEIIIQHHWGINQSPWWVMYYDMLLCMLESNPSRGAVCLPGLRLRESLDVGLDQAELVQHRERFLPWYIIDDDGVHIREPMEGWENNLVLSCLGRGNGRFQIYARLELLKEKDWAFLQAVWRLLEKEFPHFLPTQKILGIPEKGEVYGYAHFSNSRGFLVLYNPCFEEREVELKLADYLSLNRKVDQESPYRVRSLYPETKEVICLPQEVTTLGLSPFEVSLLEVEKAEKGGIKENLILPPPSALPFESSRKLSDFREDRVPEISETELQRMLEKIKFSLPDGTFSQDLKGWLDAPAHARWWVNPRGRTKQMCYRLDLGQAYLLSRVEIECAAFPPEYSLFLSEDLGHWWEIGPRKGAERDAISLSLKTVRYVKLVPYWKGDKAGDWGIMDIRFYQRKGSEDEMIPSANWLRNGFFTHRTRITRIYRTWVSFDELKSEIALKGGLLCVPLQTRLEDKPWYGEQILGYNVPHNYIFLIVRGTELEFIFQPTPVVGFIHRGSWVTFTHPVEPLAKGGDLELIVVMADIPEEVVLQGSVYLLSG